MCVSHISVLFFFATKIYQPQIGCESNSIINAFYSYEKVSLHCYYHCEAFYAECFLIRGIKMGIKCYLINIKYRQINCYDDNLLKFKQRNIACFYYGQLCTMKNRYSLIFGSWIPIKTKYWLIFYLFLEFQVTVRMIIPASTSKPKNIFPQRL